MKKTLRQTLTVALAVTAAAAGLALHHISAGATGDAPVSAEELYSKSFPDAAGQAHPMADLKGHVVVINFWATWCVPCVEEIPALSRISSSYGKKVEFVGIGIDSATNIAEFEKKIQASYPLLVASSDGSELVRDFGDNAGGLPFTIVIDKKGNIKNSKLGPVDEAELRRWLAPLTKS
jgi:thiol-disulfide isomerase/thioredoxin